MAQVSVTVVDITRTGGGVEIQLSDGHAMEFGSELEFIDWLKAWRTQLPMVLLAMGLDKYRNVDPDFSNIAVIRGKSIAYNSDVGISPLVELV